MQFLNVYYGGTLYDDLVSRKATTQYHRVAEIYDNNLHKICIEKETFLASIYGAGEHMVNSIHHQGINQLAEGMTVEARSEDGVIEAIKYTKAKSSIVMGIQWHPEYSGNSKTVKTILPGAPLLEGFIKQIKS